MSTVSCSQISLFRIHRIRNLMAKSAMQILEAFSSSANRSNIQDPVDVRCTTADDKAMVNTRTIFPLMETKTKKVCKKEKKRKRKKGLMNRNRLVTASLCTELDTSTTPVQDRGCQLYMLLRVPAVWRGARGEGVGWGRGWCGEWGNHRKQSPPCSVVCKENLTLPHDRFASSPIRQWLETGRNQP